MSKEIGIHEPGLSSYDQAEVPKAILDDAIRFAKEFIGKNQKRMTYFQDQLVGMYMEVKDSDVVIIFNIMDYEYLFYWLHRPLHF